MLRPLSGADLRRGKRLRLVHKLAAGVNTIDVNTATKCGIAVANMPGACTVGLVGYGNIAKHVSTIVSAMSATVLHTSTRDDGRPGWRRLPDLLGASDIVSLHLPLTAQTHHLLGRDTLARMKPNAVLINTSRGAVIDEVALVEALRDGRLAAAGLDVFEVEPVAPDHPLLGLDNVVLTPHVTWYTADTMRRYLAEAVANCRRLCAGDPLTHVVNQPTGC